VAPVTQEQAILGDPLFLDPAPVEVDVAPQVARRLLPEADPPLLRALPPHLDLIPTPVDVANLDGRQLRDS
jgi:hypothetical protein